LSHYNVCIMNLVDLSCQLQYYHGFVVGGYYCTGGPIATDGAQLTAVLVLRVQHSWHSLHTANTLQATISMRHEGLAVSPTVNQTHVDSLAMVSVAWQCICPLQPRTTFKSVKRWQADSILQETYLSCFAFCCRCGHFALIVCLVQLTSHLDQHAAMRMLCIGLD